MVQNRKILLAFAFLLLGGAVAALYGSVKLFQNASQENMGDPNATGDWNKKEQPDDQKTCARSSGYEIPNGNVTTLCSWTPLHREVLSAACFSLWRTICENNSISTAFLGFLALATGISLILVGSNVVYHTCERPPAPHNPSEGDETDSGSDSDNDELESCYHSPPPSP